MSKMPRDLPPASQVDFQWRSTLLLNYRFASKIYAGLFGLACLGQFYLLFFAPKEQPGGVVLYTLPIVVGLLVYFEWSEVISLRKHLESVVTRDIDYPAASIWLAAMLESIAPLAGFSLIGGLIGWHASLGGPPLIAIVLIPLISILRLDFRLCLLQGFLGALGYWLMVLMAVNQSNAAVLSEGAIILFGKGVILIGTGGLAGIIARQIRQRLHEVIYAQDRSNEG